VNYARYQQLESGLSGIAKKVLSVIPLTEEWDSRKIMGELLRATRSSPDLRVIEGCLRAILDAGLAKEVARGMYRRVPVPAKPIAIAKPQLEPESSQEAPMPKEKPPIDSSLDKLANAAAALRGLAFQFNKIAGDIEDAALLAQQQIQDERKKSERFHQLKRLLAEEGE
jgi:hypothetical protein